MQNKKDLEISSAALKRGGGTMTTAFVKLSGGVSVLGRANDQLTKADTDEEHAR